MLLLRLHFSLFFVIVDVLVAAVDVAAVVCFFFVVVVIAVVGIAAVNIDAAAAAAIGIVAAAAVAASVVVVIAGRAGFDTGGIFLFKNHTSSMVRQGPFCGPFRPHPASRGLKHPKYLRGNIYNIISRKHC